MNSKGCVLNEICRCARLQFQGKIRGVHPGGGMGAKLGYAVEAEGTTTFEMMKVTVETYKSDKYYPKIVRAVAAILAKGDVVAPVDVFIQMDLLSASDVEAWRFRRVPYLERSIRCSLGKASRILRILRMHAHDLNMRPSVTAYVSWGKGARTPLRFSKTGEPALEKAYSLHFLSPSLRSRSKGSIECEAKTSGHETVASPVQAVEATMPEISAVGEQ